MKIQSRPAVEENPVMTLEALKDLLEYGARQYINLTSAAYAIDGMMRLLEIQKKVIAYRTSRNEHGGTETIIVDVMLDSSAVHTIQIVYS